MGCVAKTLPPHEVDALVGDWLSLSEVSSRLGVTPSRLRQLLREHRLLAARRPDGTTAVPAAFLDGSDILKGLHGTPVQAMAQHRGTEVNRLAQALAF